MDNKNELSLGVRLKELRKSLNLTQKELAEKSGLKTTAIISYENNQREPTGRALASLEKTFNVSGSYLFGDNDSYIHNDKEIMDTIDDVWTNLFSNIINGIKKNDPLTKKLIFNIMVEIKIILNSKSMSSHQKSISISLIHDLITGLSLSTDRAIINNKNNSIDEERLNDFKEKRIKEYAQLLNVFFADFNK